LQWVVALKEEREGKKAVGRQLVLEKAILSPSAISAVATCQKNRQGEKNDKKNQVQFITFKSC
jgi:hypothetical protein